MKINSIFINNYKGINLSASLSDRINVITGKNGSGKSNLLEAVRLGLGEETNCDSNVVSKFRNIAMIKITLADKSLILDKYNIIKKLYKSGTIKTYKNDDLPNDNIDCLLLDYDSHCFMNQEKLEKFVLYLKEQAKTKQIIIVSLAEEIIETADCVIEMQRVGDGYIRKIGSSKMPA